MFKDWEDTANVVPLVLPIRGKPYTIPALGYLSGIKLQEETERIRAGQAPTLGNEEFLALVLGADLLKQMREDDLPTAAVVHASSVAYADALQGREAAEKLWNEGPDPEALAAALKAFAANSTTSPATQPRKRSSSTKPPASSASTRSRKASSTSSGTRSSRSRG